MNLYRCRDCEHQFEHKKQLKKCPECKSKEVFEASHYKDPESGKWYLYKYNPGPYISIRLGDNEVKNLEHLGRRNWEKDEKAGIIKESEQKKAEREADLDKKKPLPNGMKRIKTKKASPWWREGKVDQSLGDMSDRKREEYIMTGNK